MGLKFGWHSASAASLIHHVAAAMQGVGGSEASKENANWKTEAGSR
jgi:hypothetical protein